VLLKMLDPAFALETWNRSLPRSRQGEPRLSALSVLDATNGPRWSVQYVPQLRFQGKDRAPTRLLVAQCFPDGELQGALSRTQRQQERLMDKNNGLADWIVSLPAEQLLLYPFPLDPKLRRLPEAVDSRTAWQLFSEQPGLIPEGWETPDHASVEVLRYVPARRCQLRYMFRRNGRVWQLLGKMFREGRGETLFEDMQSVAGHFERHAPVDLTSPPPLAYLPEWNMVLQTHFPGSTLYQLMHQGLARDDAMAGAARSVSHLHSASFPLGVRYSMEDELTLLSRSVAQLRHARLADDRFSSLLARIEECSKQISFLALVPVHRDFYDKQLLIHDGTTALIDLDTLALGPPEIDLANFLAHLELRRLQGVLGSQQAAVWAALFFKEYDRCSTVSIDPQLIRFFMIATFLRLACKYRLKQHDKALAGGLLVLAASALQAFPDRGLMECAL
jgi:aminoglycoside phosphotransferase (APT) family kinase protein